MEAVLSKDPTKKLFEYIALLEKTSEELVNTLKKCVELLTQFKSSVPDPQGWQEMLNVFEETIKVGERIVGEKTLH
jgi:hypothetical protein